MKRREIIEFEVGKMEVGGTSSTIIGKRNVQMKGGITGQKVKASVKKTNSQKSEVKLLEVLEKSPLETLAFGLLLSIIASGTSPSNWLANFLDLVTLPKSGETTVKSSNPIWLK